MSYVVKTNVCGVCGDPCAQKLCAACAHAGSHADLRRGGHNQRYKDCLPARCWCERTTVWVPKRMIWNGLTASCGAKECRRAA